MARLSEEAGVAEMLVVAGFKRTVRWACAVAADRFTLNDDDAGFTVTEP